VLIPTAALTSIKRYIRCEPISLDLRILLVTFCDEATGIQGEKINGDYK
jgi:hypothetical protein